MNRRALLGLLPAAALAPVAAPKIKEMVFANGSRIAYGGPGEKYRGMPYDTVSVIAIDYAKGEITLSRNFGKRRVGAGLQNFQPGMAVSLRSSE